MFGSCPALYEVIGYAYSHSSILIMCIKVQILYQLKSIWMLISIFGMPVFLYTLLFFHQFYAKAENTPCQMMGDPKYPLLSMDGDITIGGLFSIHSAETLSLTDFTQKLQLLSCSRFVILATIWVGYLIQNGKKLHLSVKWFYYRKHMTCEIWNMKYGVV